MNIRRVQAQIIRETILGPRDHAQINDMFKIVQSLGTLLKTIETVDMRKRIERLEKQLEMKNAEAD